ncbi:MAG: alginate export family protein [Spirochaetota bacterium]
MTRKKFTAAIVAASFLFTAFSGALVAQADPDDDKFVPLSEMKPLEKTEGYRNPHSFQYGVSASNTLINEKQVPLQEGSTQKINDLRSGLFLGNYRPYLKYMWNEQHVFNVRGRITYKNNPSLSEDARKNGSVVSTAEYSVELLNAELDFDQHKVTAGRSFYRMGRGLLFANFADGAEYTGNFKYLQVKALALYSGQYGGCTISISGCATNGDVALKGAFDIVPGRPIDAAVPDPGRRFFIGTEIQSASLYGSNLYLMALYSRDMSRDPGITGSNQGRIFAFDPLYMGAGLQGFIATPRLRYLAEGVLQQGKTYKKNTTTNVSNNEQISINAWAVTADLNYSLPYFEKLLKPGLVAQYAYATGRDAQSASPNNPAQESTSDVDNNFYSFGVYSAGLALKPKLANLHVIRVGAQFRPLHHYYWGRNLMIAVKYTLYRKGNAERGISDVDATVNKADVGSGLDIQTVWDIRSDLKFFYAYGYFAPGAAYLEKDAKSIHSHIVSLNFLF